VSAFARKLIRWQRRHGRHGLPWQGTRDPYRVWLAEIMLQQTQVAAVIPYYERFLAHFPDVGALAAASEDEVLRLWSGLGYYARGRNLRKAARAVADRGGFPDTAQGLLALPGVGRSTAAAIAAFAFGRRAAILDGDVKRVLARRFGVEGEAAQWALAEKLLPARDIAGYTQALMDLGATVCTRANPACARCPLAKECVALNEGRVAELPSPRKRKPLPLRRVNWIVLLHRGSVHLERRPSPGIWGGLWSLPEGPARDVQSFCRKTFSCEVGVPRRMPMIEHGFTHYRLDIQPIRCEVRRFVSRPRGFWLDLEDATRAAVPAPLRLLLAGLLKDQAA
jgi:A/G-specific adenine glycosylase